MQDILAAKHRHRMWMRVVGAMMAVVVFCTTYALILPAITMGKTAYCGIEEHVHTDSCYTLQEVPQTALSCTLEDDAESIVHTHDEYCYDDTGALICTLAERQAHTHEEACYSESGELICEQLQTSTHQHTEACQSMAAEEVLTCGREEHTHTEQCFSEPEALTFAYEDDLVSGIITLPWDETLPEDLSCTVIALDDEDEGYEDMLKSIDRTLYKDSMSRLDIQLYRLEWQSGDEEYTLPEGFEPIVELTMLEQFDTSDGAQLTGLVLSGTTEADADTAEPVSGETAGEEEEAALTVSSVKKQAASRNMTASMDEAETADEAEADSTIDDAQTADSFDVQLVDVTAPTTLSVNLANGSSVIGLAAISTVTTVTNGYYRRVSDMNDLAALAAHNNYKDAAQDKATADSWNKFVFVFDNGMYALEGATNCTATANSQYPLFQLHKVEVQEVPGNPQYFTITESSGAKAGTVYSPTTMSTVNYLLQTPHPNYSGSEGSVFILREYGGDPDGWAYLRDPDNKKAGAKYSDGIRFDYDDFHNVFRLYTSDSFGNYWLDVSINPKDEESTYSIYAEKARVYQTDSFSLQITDDNTSASVDVKKADILNDNSNMQPENGAMSIYVYEENVTLSVPDIDLKGNSEIVLPRATKPDYEAPGAGYEAQAGTETENGFTYVSDASTSHIESIFSASSFSGTQEEIYAQQQKNDGRIATDKTVVYGMDDYQAFNDYEADEFSVTLSALGQEWTISDEENLASPIDVMFVLDFSTTMTSAASTDPYIQRWRASVQAVNQAMQYVLESNPDNRVGVVAYASEAKTVIPLGRYVVDTASITSGYTNGFLSYNQNVAQAGSNSIESAQMFTVESSSGLCIEKTGEPGVADTTQKCGGTVINFRGTATYTQLGFQQAYKEFSKASTTVTYTLSNGTTATVKRKPVIIHQTDGEPSYATYSFMDPENGSLFGTGGYGESGMLGYYTILSANYFKNMISNYYDNTAAFYSIGIGINASGSRSYSAETGVTNYTCDDVYRRAVIDPSDSRLEELMTKPDYASYGYPQSQTEGMEANYYNASLTLYKLLKGTASPTTYIQNTGIIYDYPFLEQWMRGITNPFTKNFAYSDDAFFYGTFTEDDLKETFNNIIEHVTLVNNYGFLLKDNSDVTITDPIGEDMEVKEDPKLSYFGKVYEYTGKTVNNGYTEYTWDIEVTRQDSDSKGEGKTLNLSAIKARVYTDEDGNQTVTFIIPEDLMPTYYPDLHKQFYYEELPVRLIYKVGPTTTAAATAKSGQQFYTNTFGTMDEEDEEYDLSMMADTIVQIMPAENNPYYFGDSAQTSTAVAKTENSTDTAADSFVEYVSGNVVTQLLGNNGMLTMGDVVKLSIIKAWDGVEAANRAPVTVWLFRQKQYDDGTEGSVDYYGSYTLNEDNHWTQSLKALDRSGTDDDGKGFIWQYYVTESVTDIYKYGVTYIGEDGSVLSYITLKTTQGGVDYDALRLYPVNGVTTITNRSSSLTINKNWEKDEPGADSVTVNLYRTRTPMQGSAAPRSELIETITLSSSNNWSYTRQNAPSVAFDTDYMTACYYDYYVEEVPVTGYNAAYSVGDGIDVPPTRLTVNGESITAYPASGNVTITNTKVIPKITVTKEWSDGYDSHSTNGISVGLFQRILVDETDADALEYQYLLVDRQWLTPDNSWSYTWTLPDEIGKTLTFDSLAYTVVDYCVAELSSTDGYTPVFYSVDDDGNRTEMASFATKTEYYQFNGAKVIQDVEHVDESVTLYRADSRIVIRNTANDILTVRKEWEDGIYQQDEVQVELIPMSDFGEGQLVAVASTTFTQETGIDCHIVLSADNDWTYTWTDLPLSLSNDDETVPITYYVRENETLYTPTYTDGSGIPAQTGTTDSKEVIPAALRPGDGVIVITNHVRNTELTLTKTWQGVPSDEWEAVTVNVYRNQYSMTISETLMKPELENEGELYATVELSADNEWTSSVNLPLVKIDADGTAHTYEYYIRELEGSVQYNVSYTLERDIGDLKLEQVEMIAESGNYMADLSFLMGYGPSNHVIITNAATYTLPHAGGIGTYWYKWSGTALLMIAAALYIFFRYRQKNRGKC